MYVMMFRCWYYLQVVHLCVLNLNFLDFVLNEHSALQSSDYSFRRRSA